MPRVAIVAGEASGDYLGTDLIRKIRQYHPDVSFYGIGGDAMKQAGCDCLYQTSELSVMGISEVFKKLLRIWSIRNQLQKILIDNPPHAYIGIDAPDFNFALERNLRKKNIKVIHYVSPSVWAWREYRIKSIKQSVNLLLTLFPFENNYYEKYGVPVLYVGHPVVDKVKQVPDTKDCRKLLNLDPDRPVIAIMPGSRRSELLKHVKPFVEAALICTKQNSKLQILCNLVDLADIKIFESVYAELGEKVEIKFTQEKSLEVMSAADSVILASGTVALEAMLLKKPMVVAYRVNWMTFQIAKRLIKLPYVSLPNILAREHLVPEYLQADCRPDLLAEKTMEYIQDPSIGKKLAERFSSIEKQLAPMPGQQIADHIYEFIKS